MGDFELGGSEGSLGRLENLEQTSLAEFSQSKMGSVAGLKAAQDFGLPNALPTSSSPAGRILTLGSAGTTGTFGRNLARFTASAGKFDALQNRSPTLVDKLASKHQLSGAQVEQKMK